MSKQTDNSPRCERCSDPVEEHGEHCPQCAALLLELEADEAWPVFLGSLKVGREWVEQIDGALTGWKYAGGKIELGLNSKGTYIARANNLLFTRGNCAIQYRSVERVPCLDLCHAGELWATFMVPTPINIILAAIAAI